MISGCGNKFKGNQNRRGTHSWDSLGNSCEWPTNACDIRDVVCDEKGENINEGRIEMAFPDSISELRDRLRTAGPLGWEVCSFIGFVQQKFMERKGKRREMGKVRAASRPRDLV